MRPPSVTNPPPGLGRRLVLCDRADCKWSGAVPSEAMLAQLELYGQPPPWFWCNAPTIIMERRANRRPQCAAFVPK